MLENGVRAHECLTLTFSKKAATEMESRIDSLSVQLPGYDTQSIKVSTVCVNTLL
jgi:superfamily I DNA/RNA helicase